MLRAPSRAFADQKSGVSWRQIQHTHPPKSPCRWPGFLLHYTSLSTPTPTTFARGSTRPPGQSFAIAIWHSRSHQQAIGTPGIAADVTVEVKRERDSPDPESVAR